MKNSKIPEESIIKHIFPNLSFHGNCPIDNPLNRRLEVNTIIEAISKNINDWVCIDSYFTPKQKRIADIINEINEKFGFNYVEFKKHENGLLFCRKISNINIIRVAALTGEKYEFFENFLKLLYSDFICNTDCFNNYFLMKVYCGLRISPNEIEEKIHKYFQYRISIDNMKVSFEFEQKLNEFYEKIHEYLKINESLKLTNQK